MNENIDLTEILKGCPKGTELYSTIYGKVRFERISNSDFNPIEIKFLNKFTNPSLVNAFFAKDGRCTSTYDGECTLFPSKDQRDWSKFKRFWDKPNTEKFDTNIDLIKILEGCPKGTKFYSIIHGEITFRSIQYSTDYPIRFDSDVTGGSVPLTREGKTIRNAGECIVFPSKDQRDWSKFERFWDKPKVEKFDVNTLHPFDKVLTRCDDSEKWGIDLFGYFDNLYKGVCCLDAYLQMCIPYNDETKHLLGTTNDCPDYYKWWEK